MSKAGDMLVSELALAIDLGNHFDSLGVRWLIGGSVASSILGVPRTTTDVDLVADLRGAHVKPLAASLIATYYVDEDVIGWAVKERRSFNAIHDATSIKIDVFCARDDELGRAELDRRVMLPMRGTEIPLSSPEDIILEKLIWHRDAGGSERQWNDAKGVFEVCGPTLDLTYLRYHARANGISDLIEKLLAS
ncbi:MAG: hypothetical protein WKG01_17765 [Kofleriaceae bacterium]